MLRNTKDKDDSANTSVTNSKLANMPLNNNKNNSNSTNKNSSNDIQSLLNLVPHETQKLIPKIN